MVANGKRSLIQDCKTLAYTSVTIFFKRRQIIRYFIKIGQIVIQIDKHTKNMFPDRLEPPDFDLTLALGFFFEIVFILSFTAEKQ